MGSSLRIMACIELVTAADRSPVYIGTSISRRFKRDEEKKTGTKRKWTKTPEKEQAKEARLKKKADLGAFLHSEDLKRQDQEANLNHLGTPLVKFVFQVR